MPLIETKNPGTGNFGAINKGNLMQAMLLRKIQMISPDSTPLEWSDIPIPEPSGQEILVKVSICGVCHTELDEIEGRLPPTRLPMIPGHQVVGRVIKAPNESLFKLNDRVGIAWIASACGECEYCISGQENLCHQFQATGKDRDGGYAQYALADQRFMYPIPDSIPDHHAAPLLCAGAIGYRSLRLAGLQDGQNLGLSGFGASAHIVLQLALFKYPHSRIFIFSRSEPERRFALSMGAYWAGEYGATPPEYLHSIIDTTPAWLPVLESLRCLAPGGRLVINAIRKEDADKIHLSHIDYASFLWLEKEIKSVANVCRTDVSEFLSLAAAIPILPEYQEFALRDANRALLELKNRNIHGAKILVI
jgi:propanol-preferring alcohol dehydrogenase